MRLILSFSLCCLLATSAFAQHRGGGGGGMHAGGGHSGFTGGGHSGSIGGGHSFIGGRTGNFGHGYNFNRGFRRFDRDDFYRRGFYGRGFYGGYWPWYSGLGFWPLWWDSNFFDWDWDNGSDSSYPQAAYPYSNYSGGPNVTVIAPPPQPMYPAVINIPAQPVIHEYRQPEDYGLPEEHHRGPILYLIAFNDHQIRAALAYWIDDDTLHYVDMDHKEKRAPLSSVDRDFSAQLNRERHVPFRL